MEKIGLAWPSSLRKALCGPRNSCELLHGRGASVRPRVALGTQAVVRARLLQACRGAGVHAVLVGGRNEKFCPYQPTRHGINHD